MKIFKIVLVIFSSKLALKYQKSIHNHLIGPPQILDFVHSIHKYKGFYRCHKRFKIHITSAGQRLEEHTGNVQQIQDLLVCVIFFLTCFPCLDYLVADDRQYCLTLLSAVTSVYQPVWQKN